MIGSGPIDLELGLPRRRPDLWDGLFVAAGTSWSSRWGPDVPTASHPDALVEHLAAATHSGVDGAGALHIGVLSVDDVARVLTAAVAALTGQDVRAAFDAPDLDRVCGLNRSAREALRDVVGQLLVPGDLLDSVVADLQERRAVESAGS